MWRRLTLFTIYFLILIAGVVSLIWNKGFYYAFYNTTHIVKVVEAAPPGTLDSVSVLNGAAAVDRNLSQVSFQNLSKDTVESQLSQVTTDNNYTISTILRNEPANWLLKLLVAGFAFIVSAVIYIYWTARQLKSALSFSKHIELQRNFLLLTAVFVLMSVGALSLISTVYVLTEISLVVLGISLIIWSLNWAKGIEQLLVNWNTFETDAERWGFLQLDLTSTLRRTAWLGLIIVSILSFGLGAKFIIEGVIWATLLLFAWITVLLWSQGGERIWNSYVSAVNLITARINKLSIVKKRKKTPAVKPAEVKAKRVEKKAKATKITKPTTSKKKAEKKRRN